MRRQFFFFALCASLWLNACSPDIPAAIQNLPPGTYARFDTSQGEVIAHLYPEAAPRSIRTFTNLANGRLVFSAARTSQSITAPYYDGLRFHRIMKDVLVQGGDPTATSDPTQGGRGNPGWHFNTEFSADHHFDHPGVLAMSNTGESNSSNAQFFITLVPQPNMEGRYTILGDVIAGFQNVQAWNKLPLQQNETPSRPITIHQLRIYVIDAEKHVHLG